MTHPIRTAAASVAAVALLLPAGASAQGGGHGQSAPQLGSVPARVKAKVKRVEQVLDRVSDHASDGDDAAALKSITALDKAVASATKAGVKKVGTEKGPASVGRVAWAEDDVAVTTADLLDGASADLSTGLAGSLDGALDGRDALVAAIAALPAADQADYADALERLAEDSADEAEAFTEGVADDELTDAAKTALTAAATQATATAAAAGALVADDGTGDVADDSATGAAGDRGDCPRGGGRGDASSSGSQDSGSGTTSAQGTPSRRM